ncbi:MAG: IclR family transcriptional regulator [Spirochaetaceae bacterium JB067]
MDQTEQKVLAVERTMTILEYLAKNGANNLSTISKDISIHKSTLYRFLHTLCSMGYVYKNSESENYSLTQKMNRFLNMGSKYSLLHQFAVPVMEQLSELTKETIHLATLEDLHIKYIYKIESTLSLRVVTSSHRGGGAPLYCTGLGKALLSRCDKEQQAKILLSLTYEKKTKNTITDPLVLSKELQRIREQGYAIDNEEHEEGIYCIASPIQNSLKVPIAAVSITGPASRMIQKKEEYSKLIKEKVAQIEQHL